MILEIIRNMYGYVKFEVTGGFPEKFLNLSVKERYHLWDVRRRNGDLIAKTDINTYPKLRYNAFKSNSKLKILKKKGMPFLVARYKSRFGVLVGVSIFAMIILILPLYVWKVDIVGCESVNPDEIRKVMSELGVSGGTLKSRINVAAIKQQAMQRLDCVSWMSVNINGSNVEVAIKEKQQKPDAETIGGEPSNIVAGSDGRIERMETYCGTPVVSDGDVVVKGQLLISGVVEDLSGCNEFVDASGNVYAQTHRVLSETVKMNQVYASDVGEEIRKYRIKVFNVEIPLGFSENFDESYRYETEEKVFKILDFKLPLTVYKDKIQKQEVCERKLSEEEAEREADKCIKERETEEFSEETQIKNIEARSYYTGESQEEYRKEYHYDLIEDIAKKERLMLEN